MELRTCPNCIKDIDTKFNRLITEKCGHIKCRDCFISETNGCFQCQQNITIENPINTFDKSIELKNLDTENTTSSSNGELCIDTDSYGTSSNSIIDNRQTEEIEITKNLELNSSQINSTNLSIIVDNSNLNNNTEKITSDKRNSKKSKKSFPSHIIKYSEGNIQYFKCNICNKRFKSRNQQYYHLYCADKEKKPYKCDKCSKSFASSSHLNYHMDSHSEPDKYICKICSKNFSGRITFEKHSELHENTIKYKCDKCNINCRSKSSLTAHLNKHANIFPFKCLICDKKFSFKSNLTQHMRSHSHEEKRFQCNNCGKKFNRKSTYDEHLLRHNKYKNFLCQLCSKTFIDRKTLDRHTKIHGSNLYGCSFCNIKSTRKDNLIRHIRNMHPKENIKDALEKIKTSTNTHETIDQNKIIDNQLSEIITPNEDDDEIIIPEIKQFVTTSVIKSIGNVKPVSSKIQIISNEVLPKTPPDILNNEKPPKKKYDPFEIYRKILSVSNEDDSILDPDELQSNHSQDTNENCCDNFLNKTKTDLNNTSNFREIHWRKRTSLNFFSAL